MGRFAAGVVSALLLCLGGFFLWRSVADKPAMLAVAPAPPPPASEAPLSAADLAPPPRADEKTKEERRFARYDKDRDAAVSQDEFLAGRRKGFAKLDRNGDGRLSFEEYAVKGVERFAAADRDRNRQLNAAEFATTRVVRKAKPKPRCAPVMQQPDAEAVDG